MISPWEATLVLGYVRLQQTCSKSFLQLRYPRCVCNSEVKG
jgi:hypothetical protein